MIHRLFLCLTFCWYATQTVLAGDWPQLLGPRANGISDETGLLDKWPANGLHPSFGRKVLGRVMALRQSSVKNWYSIIASVMKRSWSVWMPRPGNHFGITITQAITSIPYGYNNGATRATPLLTSNACYTFGAEGKLTCLELETGKLVWQRDTAADFKVPEAFFGAGSTPILEGGLLIVMVGGQPNSGVVAFDAGTGKTVWESVGQANWEGVPMTGWPGQPPVKWKSWDKQASYSTPVAAIIHGRRQILCLTRQGLVSLDPKTGAVNFSFWFRSTVNDSVNAMCPVVVDDLIFISGAYYKIGSVLLREAPDGKSVEEVWRSTAMELHWTTPIYLDGYLYAFSGRNEPDARMRCVELRTGKLMWEVDESWRSHSTRTPGRIWKSFEHSGGRKIDHHWRGRIARVIQAEPREAGGDLPISSAAIASSVLGRASAIAKKALPAK